MIKYFSLIDGKFSNTISVLDRGLAYGDGLFETMVWEKVFSKKNKEMFGVEFWEKHLKRLKKGCLKMRINFPERKLIEKNREKILNYSFKKGISNGILKIIVTRGVGGRGYKFDKSMKPTLIMLSFPNKSKISNF